MATPATEIRSGQSPSGGPAPAPPAPAGTSAPLSSVDFAWLRMDEPENLMMINGVLVTEGPIDLERLRRVIERRLLPIPRFRQRVVVPRQGAPRWETVPDFRLEDHVLPLELPAPGGDEGLREVIGRLASTPLDPVRPLWYFHVIQGYQGGSVVFARLHHAIGDGVALMLVLLSIADLTPDASPESAETMGRNPFTELLCRTAPIEQARALVEKVMPDGLNLLLHPVSAFKAAGRFKVAAASVGSFGRLVFRRPDPKTVFKGPLGVPKRYAWSEAIPVATVKAVGKALGGTVNDVLTAAMAGGLHRYLERAGKAPEVLNFRAAMPVNLRPLEKMCELGNQFGLIFLSLPVGRADPVSRLAELQRRARALKRSVEPVVVYGILRAIGRMPLGVQRLVVRIFATKATAVMTNVPGPREQLYLVGRPIRDVIFWVPQAGHVGLGVAICSYNGRVRLGVGTDAGLIPDPEAIVLGFHQELAEMERLAAAAASR